MAERLPEQNESPEVLRGVEGLKGPERQQSVETKEQAEVKQAEELEGARSKLEHTPEPANEAERESKAKPHPTRLDKEAAYWDTLRSMRRHLKPLGRNFSKLIHTPIVERSSAVVGATVARPSVTLGATLGALVIGGFLYFTARIYGFSLSGSELLLSLVAGGVLGLFVEGIAKLFKRT